MINSEDTSSTKAESTTYGGRDSSHEADDDERLLTSHSNHGAAHEDAFTSDDAFVPFDDLPDEKSNILTFRAIAIGLLCGGLVNAANIYVGLKAGWTSSANIFGVSLP